MIYSPGKIIMPLFLALVLCLPLQAQDQPESLEVVIILKIIDGDTFKISCKGEKERLRLIGIDTPESWASEKAERDAKESGQDLETLIAQGKEAAKFVKSLVSPGDTVLIEFDVGKRDRYGRLLGYVYLSDGKMLNEEILKAGYAGLMTIPPNVKYRDRLLKAYKLARESKAGLWSGK